MIGEPIFADLRQASPVFTRCHGVLSAPPMLPLSSRMHYDLATLRDSMTDYTRRIDQDIEALANTNRDDETVRKIRHDLRNILNLIVGFSNLLLREIPPPFTPQQHQALKQVYETSKHLMKITYDLR